MADENEAIVPELGQETATEPPETNTDDDTTEVETDETGETEGDEPETLEIEWDDGKKYVIPKALEGGLLRNKDYTQKRQADAASAAERSKQLDARDAQIEERYKASDEELDLRAQLRSVNADVERFKNFDWNAYQAAKQSDPLGADEAWDYAQHIRNQKAELDGQLSQAQAKRTEAAQVDLNRRVQETLAAAPTVIPGWQPEKANETISGILSFADSMGIPEQLVKANWSPTMLRALHLMQLGHQLSTKPAAPKPKPAPLTPPTTVGGGRTTSSSPDDREGIKAWMEKRNKQVRGRA